MSFEPKKQKKIDFRKLAIGKNFDKDLEIIEGNLNESIERKIAKYELKNIKKILSNNDI